MSTTVRPAVASDEDALAELGTRVVDGGAVAFTTRHRVPLLEAAGPDSAGFVAETGSELVGAAWVRVGRCRLFGAAGEYAMLHSLSVAPEARRRGVARALTDARLSWVTDQSALRGKGITPMATIQRGNAASLANARRWATAFTGELQVTPVPVRTRAPRAHPEWDVALGSELPQLDEVAGLGPDLTPDALRGWLDHTVRGEIVNHLHVATDASGQVLAALGVHDDTPVGHLVVARMPRAAAVANRFVRVVGPDGAMRTAQVAFAWNRDAAAGRHLWQHVRWHWRERVTSIVTTVDPTDPMARMTRAPRWIPTTRISVALQSQVARHAVPGPVRLPL